MSEKKVIIKIILENSDIKINKAKDTLEKCKEIENNFFKHNNNNKSLYIKQDNESN